MGGKKLLYAYIRKNASSTFRAYINQKTHPKYLLDPKNILKKLMGMDLKNRNHIDGNMKYFRHSWSKTVKGDSYDAIIFVYRDPLERLLSTFKNKFIDDIYASGIQRNFEELTGCEAEQATFTSFVEYTYNDFSRLNPHVTPQKSALWELNYTPIKPSHLNKVMREITDLEQTDSFFGSKRNASEKSVDCYEDGYDSGPLYNTSVCDLRVIAKEGRALPITNFISNEIRDKLRSRYAQDYEMIAQIEAQK